MPTEIKVISRVMWKKKDYVVKIDGNMIRMIYEEPKGVQEVLEKMNKDGLSATLENDRTILRIIEGFTEQELVEKAKAELDIAVRGAKWPVKFSYEEVKL